MSTFLLNKKYLPHRVGVCFIIGIIAGLFFHDFSIWVKPAGDLFMNMIKMLIVPVIFFSVTSGIAAIGDVQRLKRIGSKVVIVYFLMTVIACIVGIVMVNITHPGVGFTLDNMQAFDTSKVKTPSFVNFLFDMVPVNIVDSMAKNQIMQMIFFTVLVGVALVSLGEKVAGVTKIFDQCASIIYKMLDIVMLYSPIGVLALMANTTAVFGPKLFGVLAKFVFTDWVGCLLIWFFFSGIVWLYTKVNYLEMCKSMIPIWVNTIASISKDVWNRTLTVNGFSKAYAMTGWRIGYVAANKTIIDAIKKIQSQTTSATSAISQKAAVAALSGPQHDLEVMVAEFDKRRIYLLQRLAEMPGISCAKPRGAFYLLPDFSCYFGKKYRGREIKDAVDFANILLEAVLVALVPGEAFNIKGKVRLSYSNSMKNLKEAMDRIQSFVRELE